MKMLALILAGGQGTRLGVMTNNLAKPAVPFGGKYRIIDFAISNCVNSGINTVGVVTQYMPHQLVSHIGIGKPWDLDIKDGGIHVLPPYLSRSDTSWYKGTADAIYQNIEFIDIYDPEYVLILSGDHIYKMDYSLMLDYHKEKNAEATIGVLEVPLEDANRFGIMNTDDSQRIFEFQEKPEKPKNNLASMGIYIFKWETLKKYLLKDAENDDSDGDFGKNIIPAMINNDLLIYAYKFTDYWKDVGTIESYWGAHMDLLGDSPELDLHDRNWIIYSVNPNNPPQYIAETAEVDHSLINKGTQVLGKIENSVLFFGVRVERDVIIENSVILPNSRIGKGSHIKNSIIGRNVTVEANSKIGIDNQSEELKITVIGDEETVKKNSSIKSGTVVGK